MEAGPSKHGNSGCRWKCCVGYFVGFLVLALLGFGVPVYYVGLKLGIAVFAAVCVLAVIFIGGCIGGGQTHAVVHRQRRKSRSWVGERSQLSATLRDDGSLSEVISSAPVGDSKQVAFIVANGMKSWFEKEQSAKNCTLKKASTLIEMLNDGKTLPFLIRYRKNVVGDWSPKDMRHFGDLYHNAKIVVKRAANIKRNIAAAGLLNKEISRDLENAQTVAQLDSIEEFYKRAGTESTLSILEVSELNEVADKILNQQFVEIEKLINPQSRRRKTVESVKSLLSAYISEAILRRMYDVRWSKQNWMICSKLNLKEGVPDEDINKFKKFDNFEKPATELDYEEVLAMNRGEKKNILEVTLMPNSKVMAEIQQAMNSKLGLMSAHASNDVQDMLNDAIAAAQNKLLTKISKVIRQDVTRSAEYEAIKEFKVNLEKLLRTQPFKSDHKLNVLGIDPGMSNGCKTVVVDSESFSVKEHLIIYLHPFKGQTAPPEFEETLKNLLRKWKVEIIVVGNGLGCQDVRKVVRTIVKLPEFSGVRCIVVSERGLSHYSTSAEAEHEYSNLATPELISSISLVKRFFNPLDEYLKVHPKHLGIGSYQHDIDEKKLRTALEETVSQVVSDVGVDLNQASVFLLRYIPGLSASRAEAIVAHRNRRGAFKNRNELLEVNGIDHAIFEQCAGFVRIVTPSNVADRHKYNILDQTIIHPEHYSTTRKLIELMGQSMNDLGTPSFIKRVNDFIFRESFDKVSKRLDVDFETTKLLLDALSMPLTPGFRSFTSLSDLDMYIDTVDELQLGMTVSGEVENVMASKAYVYLGVEVKGILRFKKHNKPDIGPGDRVRVKIDEIDTDSKVIRLKFIAKL